MPLDSMPVGFFEQFPVILVSLADLTWPAHDILPDHLTEPNRSRAIDAKPIFVERLVTGHWYVHDGRHRSIRAQLRGEHQIWAHAYTTKERN